MEDKQELNKDTNGAIRDDGSFSAVDHVMITDADTNEIILVRKGDEQ